MKEGEHGCLKMNVLSLTPINEETPAGCRSMDVFVRLVRCTVLGVKSFRASIDGMLRSHRSDGYLSDSGTKGKQLFLRLFLHGVGTAGTLRHRTDVMSGHVCLAPIHGACLCHPLPLQTAWQGFARLCSRLRNIAQRRPIPHEDRPRQWDTAKPWPETCRCQ